MWNQWIECRSELINCFNRREMKADVINFRLMAIDTPISRNILSMISESEVALMLKVFGSSYSQGMVELDDIIIKNKNLFERMVLTPFLSQIRFLAIFRSPNIFLVIYWEHHRHKREHIWQTQFKVWGIPLRSPSQCKLCFLNILTSFFTMVLL